MKILQTLLLLIILTSCYEDMGNYQYDYMDDIKVDNLSGVNFSYKYGSEILIEPNIITTIPEDQLSFLWLRIVDGMRWDTLSHKKILNVHAFFPTSDIEFRIKHEPSGIHHTFGTQIFVANPFSSGLGFLCQTGEASEFSFLSNVERDVEGNIQWELYSQLYANVNNEPLPKGAVELLHNYGYTINGGQWGIRYDNDGFFFNADNIKKEKSIFEYFATMDYVPQPLTVDCIGFSSKEIRKGVRFVCAGGELFTATAIHSATNFSFYAPVDGTYYLKDKITRVGDDFMYLAFDEDAKRFMYVNMRNSYMEFKEVLKVDGTPNADHIDVNNLGMDCQLLETASIGDYQIIYSILKGESGYQILSMDSNSDISNDNPYDIRINDVIEINKNVFDDQTLVVMQPGTTNMWFIKDNQVHVFVGSSKVFVENWYEAESKILDFYLTSSGEIVIALANGENSVVEIRKYQDRSLITSVELKGQLIDMIKI